MSDKSKDSEIEKEPRQINFPSIMSIKEAACYLTISTYFLYGLVKAGCVPSAKIGKRIVFTVDAMKPVSLQLMPHVTLPKSSPRYFVICVPQDRNVPVPQ